MPDSGGRTLFVVSPRGERGPLDRAELRELLRQEEIAATDQVRTAFGRPLGTVAEVLRPRHAATRATETAMASDDDPRRRNDRRTVPIVVLAILGVLLVGVLLYAFLDHDHATLGQPSDAGSDTSAQPTQSSQSNQPPPPPPPDGPSLVPNLNPTITAVATQSDASQGLIAEFYRDVTGNVFPDYSKLTPALRRIDLGINVDNGDVWPGTDMHDNFSIRWTGFLRITAPGSYTIAMVSDDGSQLFLDGRKVILNDGSHAMQERTWTGNLGVGDHALEIDYLQGIGFFGAQLAWWSDNFGRKVIPAQALCHRPDAVLDKR